MLLGHHVPSCTALPIITKGKHAGNEGALSFKLWVLLAGFEVILIYRITRVTQ